jgi:hypothetical protein
VAADSARGSDWSSADALGCYVSYQPSAGAEEPRLFRKVYKFTVSTFGLRSGRSKTAADREPALRQDEGSLFSVADGPFPEEAAGYNVP